MAKKFMHIRKVIIPVLVLVAMLTQATPAFAVSAEELTDLSQNVQSVEVITYDRPASLSLLAATSSVTATANQNELTPEEIAILDQFTDIDQTTRKWAGKGLVWAIKNGIMKGVGNNRMNPSGKLTLVQFVAMLQRATLTDKQRTELEQQLIDTNTTLPHTGTPDEWMDKEMWYGVQSGITKGLNTDVSVWKNDIPRSDMAVMIDNVLNLQGQPTPDLEWVYQSISDWDSIAGTSQAQSILRVYRDGIIQGTDSYGKFAPNLTVTRATAATIAYRLMVPEARLSYTPPNNTSAPATKPGDTTTTVTDPSAPITIHEGQGASRPPKSGDTYVRPDGTEITLQMHENGVLGWGQGYMDYLSNTKDDHGIQIEVGGMAWVTIDGKDMSGVVYKGPQGVFTADQWQLIKNTTKPASPGKTNKEEAVDGLWVWKASTSNWVWMGPV